MMVRPQHARLRLRRHLVFPGGRVDPADSLLRAYCTSETSRRSRQVGATVAAIRETYEECGLLLGRTAGSDAHTYPGDEVAAFHVRDGSAAAFVAAVAASPIQLATGDLVPLAHWITPVGSPKRFDTHFFVAAVPVGPDRLSQMAMKRLNLFGTHALRRLLRPMGGISYLMVPTYMTLRRLSPYRSVAAVLEAARAQPIVTWIRKSPTRRRGGTSACRRTRDTTWKSCRPDSRGRNSEGDYGSGRWWWSACRKRRTSSTASFKPTFR